MILKVNMYSMATQMSSHLFLIRRDTVSVDTAAADCVLSLSASITGITLNGINNSVLAFLHNACVVGFSIALPVKENDCSGCRLVITVCPLSSVFEPLSAVHTTGIFRNNTGVNISVLAKSPMVLMQ